MHENNKLSWNPKRSYDLSLTWCHSHLLFKLFLYCYLDSFCSIHELLMGNNIFIRITKADLGLGFIVLIL